MRVLFLVDGGPTAVAVNAKKATLGNFGPDFSERSLISVNHGADIVDLVFLHFDVVPLESTNRSGPSIVSFVPLVHVGVKPVVGSYPRVDNHLANTAAGVQPGGPPQN